MMVRSKTRICDAVHAHDAHDCWDEHGGVSRCTGRYTYVTMTVGGMQGNTFTAPSDSHATAEATRRGYTVVDVIDGTGISDADAILVIR